MFEGIITPIVTPFNRDKEESINYEATEKLINYLIEHGVKGIFILGSNGEFHVVDEDEKVEFAKKVVEIVNKRVPVFVGTGCCSTRATLRLSKKMEEIGADALSVITPYFLKPTDENLYAHYKAVAQSVNIPIVLYNIPKATGCPLSPELVDRLADIPNIKAIKDSSGELERIQAYAKIAENKDFELLIGSDSKISYAYGLGATAAVAGTSNVIVDTLVGLDKALNEGDTETAEKLQKDIDVLRGVLKLGTVPSAMKRSVELAGIAEVGPARMPVQELSKEDDEKAMQIMYMKLAEYINKKDLKMDTMVIDDSLLEEAKKSSITKKVISNYILSAMQEKDRMSIPVTIKEIDEIMPKDNKFREEENYYLNYAIIQFLKRNR